MDLSTKYMGLELKNPLVPSASPLSREVDSVRQLEDAGSSAVVLYSLFEEQIKYETEEVEHFLEYGAESFAEALSYFPEPQEFRRGPDDYLEHIRQCKQAVDIPVIGSLNAGTPGAWTDYAAKMEQAGADGIELNVFFLPSDARQRVDEIEDVYTDIVSEVTRTLTIPVAVKMHPYFTSISAMARKLGNSGAKGLALFNRFYEPDIEPESLEVVSNLQLSQPYDTRLPLRWVGLLYDQVPCDLAATSGVHGGVDAIKLVMAGSSVVHLCSALLKYGIQHLGRVREEMLRWMEEHEYASLQEMLGSMSQRSCPDPAMFERANYIKVLQSYT
jgi:dihydroorotate dehydrogenase (fumarate)